MTYKRELLTEKDNRLEQNEFMYYYWIAKDEYTKRTCKKEEKIIVSTYLCDVLMKTIATHSNYYDCNGKIRFRGIDVLVNYRNEKTELNII